jgi:hypothetical protein
MPTQPDVPDVPPPQPETETEEKKIYQEIIEQQKEKIKSSHLVVEDDFIAPNDFRSLRASKRSDSRSPLGKNSLPPVSQKTSQISRQPSQQAPAAGPSETQPDDPLEVQSNNRTAYTTVGGGRKEMLSQHASN